jgi:hypothetical protein
MPTRHLATICVSVFNGTIASELVDGLRIEFPGIDAVGGASYEKGDRFHLNSEWNRRTQAIGCRKMVAGSKDRTGHPPADMVEVHARPI